MFQETELVKVVPKSYVDLSKNFFNYPEKWEESNSEEDETIMLGGEYNILAVRQNQGKNWYTLLKNNVNNEAVISENMIVRRDAVTTCPFRVGDKVLFRSRKEVDEQYLLSSVGKYYHLSERDYEHSITRILNNYYIFLDYEINDEHSFPFSWEDFVKV